MTLPILIATIPTLVPLLNSFKEDFDKVPTIQQTVFAYLDGVITGMEPFTTSYDSDYQDQFAKLKSDFNLYKYSLDPLQFEMVQQDLESLLSFPVSKEVDFKEPMTIALNRLYAELDQDISVFNNQQALGHIAGQEEPLFFLADTISSYFNLKFDRFDDKLDDFTDEPTLENQAAALKSLNKLRQALENAKKL